MLRVDVEMAPLNKLRRMCHGRSNKSLVTCLLLVCFLVYIAVTTSLVRRQSVDDTNEEIKIRSDNPRGMTENLPTQPEVELADDELLKLYLEIEKKRNTSKSNRMSCNEYNITDKYETFKENISCVAHRPTQSACEFADNIYWLDETLKSCGPQRKVNICQISESTQTGSTVEYVYKCSFEDCLKYDRQKVITWSFHSDTQTLTNAAVFTTVEEMEKELPYIAKLSSNNKYNFLFLECSNDEIGKQSYDLIAQLLILLPINISNTEYKKSQEHKDNTKINVNIVLLDSAARSHFYRSLPGTINTFNNVNKNKENGDEVLDFQLFQSIEGHTAENIHALFTGTLFPKHWTGAERESASVGVGKLFKQYVDHGYTTFYHDDLCFEEWWGLRLDLGSPATWQDFLRALDKNYIHHTGLSFTSCKILQTNNITNPFNGPDGPLCFNGQFQDGYLLDFSRLHHGSASRHGNRMLSFTTLNVAHDNLGKRIQSIDDELKNYVQNIIKSNNTLTLVLADHGNTYTHYTHAIMEGRFEQYHPAFFMIIPEQVKKLLGHNIMNNLRTNQRKLVTMLDIHGALQTIPTEPKQQGIFSPIPCNRSCDDLNLRLPNLCVCEGWDAETLNDTLQIGLVHFAIGELNNKILQQQKQIRQKQQIPGCLRLVPTSFKNVRERSAQGRLITSMDISTMAGSGASQSRDIFHVQIQSSINPDDVSRNMKLLNFDRISKYGPYRACADKRIDMRLCVCNIKARGTERNLENVIMHDMIQYPNLLPTNIEIKRVFKISECLFYRTISYPDTNENEQDAIYTATYEVANICGHMINVTMDITLDNMKLTSTNPVIKHLLPFGMTYVMTAIRAVPYWTSRVDSVKIYVPQDSLPLPP